MGKLIVSTPPRGLLLLGLRAPIWLYRLRLGWLLGDRFLLLEHKGRKSGRIHRTVIEVVRHDRESRSFYVVSGWGPKADWYQNIRKEPSVILQVGRRRLPAHASFIAVPEAAEIMTEYSQRYPLAFRELTGLFFQERLPPGPEAGQRLAELMPMVVFDAGQ